MLYTNRFLSSNFSISSTKKQFLVLSLLSFYSLSSKNTILPVDTLTLIEKRLNLLSYSDQFKQIAQRIIIEEAIDLEYSDEFQLIYTIENHHRLAKHKGLALNDGIDGMSMHCQMLPHCSLSRDIIKDVILRIAKEHRRNDECQKDQTSHPIRNLEALKKNGISLQFIDEKIDILKNIISKSKLSCSFTNIIKNEQLLQINEFNPSKCSLVLHDCFDHFWTYVMLEKNEILEKYKDFLQSVGNPHLTDLFNRESELIASIAYAFRFIVLGEKRNHLISFDEVKNLFETASVLTDNGKNAYDILVKRKSDEKYKQEVSSVIGDIFIELMEQRRRFGYIRKLDKNRNSIGTLPMLDLEYISLIIEVFDCLSENRVQAKHAVENTLLIFENYICKIIAGGQNDVLNIPLLEIEKGYEVYPFLSDEKAEWVKSNINALITRKV